MDSHAAAETVSPPILTDAQQVDRTFELLFELLGLWTVDVFGQMERIVGFRRRRNRGKGDWLVAVETTDLSDMLELGAVRPGILAVLAGTAEVDVEWSEYVVWKAVFRLKKQGLVLCRHLSDAVCVARARRYWRHPFEMTGAGPLWNRADRQEARLRRLILLRRAGRAGLPMAVVERLQLYLEAAEVEPRYQSDTYRDLARRMHDDRDPLGPTVWRFVKQHDDDVHRRARQLWGRFEDRFLGARERRLEQWCGAHPGIVYCHPFG